MKWNVQKIFDHHGGANDLHAKLMAAGHKGLSIRALRQWLNREKIPGHWLACVVGLDMHDPREWLDGEPGPTADPEPEVEDIF